MQYTMPIQSAGGRHHPVARRLIILAALIPADACSEQTTKAMFGEARQRLWIVINFQVGDVPAAAVTAFEIFFGGFLAHASRFKKFIGWFVV